MYVKIYMLFIGGSWININSDSFGGSSYSSIYKKILFKYTRMNCFDEFAIKLQLDSPILYNGI